MEKELQKIYIDYRNHLVDSRHKSYEQFDKAIFLLSGGGLTVSLTILKNLIPFTAAESKPLLATSWVLFVIPLVFTLISFICSQKALDKQIELTDKYYRENDEKALSGANIFSSITKYLNYSSAISFIAGVSTLLIFVYRNIS